MAESTNLKKAGLKATVPRLRIMAMLERHHDRHMSAEDVYRSLLESGEDVGLATVYRVLTQFEAAGLVVRHNFEGGHAVFELGSGDHHDHIVCVECGEVVEFVDSTIEAVGGGREGKIANSRVVELHAIALPATEESDGPRLPELDGELPVRPRGVEQRQSR